MIQRIQTLYLLVAALLAATLFFVPLAELAGKDGTLYRFDLWGLLSEGVSGVKVVQAFVHQVVLAGLIAGLTLLTVFQYKNRGLQIKLSSLIIFLLIGLLVLLCFSVWKSGEMVGGTYSLKIFFTFPALAAVLVYLAIRGMVKDEQLVKSIDRIR